MFFETPRDQRETSYVMTRTDYPGVQDDTMVLVRWAERDNEAPSWMEVGEAIQSTMLQIVTHPAPELFNEELAELVREYGPKSISGELRTVTIELVHKPARSAVHANASMIRVASRRRPEQNEGS